MKNKFKNLNVAVVGASIAGISCAILLKRLGLNVMVYEKKTKNEMNSLGMGIGVPEELHAKLKSYDLIDGDLPYININKRSVYIINRQSKKSNKLTQHSVSMRIVHWQHLYAELSKKNISTPILFGHEIVSVNSQNKTTLFFKNGDSESFDYVMFADGYNSIGRKHLFPDIKISFANYILWRGAIECDNIYDFYKGNLNFFNYEKGLCFFVETPNLSRKTKAKNKLVTWLVYEKIDDTHPIMSDGVIKNQYNISSKYMDRKYRDYFYKQVVGYLPCEIQDIFLMTDDVFVQCIYDILVPSYYKNKCALLGDAAILHRPHTASGTSKAISDILSLYNSLKKSQNIEETLQIWGEQQYKENVDSFYLNQSLGDFLVNKAYHWQNFSENDFNTGWENAIQNTKWYASGIKTKL